MGGLELPELARWREFSIHRYDGSMLLARSAIHPLAIRWIYSRLALGVTSTCSPKVFVGPPVTVGQLAEFSTSAAALRGSTV